MHEAQALLVELGTEELPPKALDELSRAFVKGVCDGLQQHGLAADFDQAHRYATPRRLAVHIPAVAAMQPDQTLQRKGPAVRVGLDDAGQPTAPLLGFARSCGVEVADLQQLETDKGAWFVYRRVQPGKSLAELLPDIVSKALAGLPIPKPMRWAAHDYTFVRPVHWLLLLHGEQLIEGEVLGLHSEQVSYGHRFHGGKALHISAADTWLQALREARVLADPLERRERIRSEVARVAAGISGTPQLSPALLDEIANLTEWPVAVACCFDREFLSVPQEALVTTMEANQKFLPVFDAAGQLSEHFIGIANIESRDEAEVRKGYERVIRPRFADARFFWDEDLQQPLEAHCEGLREVTYQRELGSLWDKTLRVTELSRLIANRSGVDAAQAVQAAALSRCDLLTRMVNEFPGLQGIVGRRIAEQQGEDPALAVALDEFYAPRQAAANIAGSALGRVVAVADRVDTLAGIFAIGLKPSGNKDPYALRRAALALARTMIEGHLELDLQGLLREALEQIPDSALAAGLKAGKRRPSSNKTTPETTVNIGSRRAQLADELREFILERLRGYYLNQGLASGVFEAVLAATPSSLTDFDRRIHALATFLHRPESQSLVAANKRAANLLRKEGAVRAALPEPEAMEEPAEQQLVAALRVTAEQSRVLVEAGKYGESLALIAQLEAPLARFFDEVMVLDENPAKRARRLAMLRHLQDLACEIADLSRI